MKKFFSCLLPLAITFAALLSPAVSCSKEEGKDSLSGTWVYEEDKSKEGTVERIWHEEFSFSEGKNFSFELLDILSSPLGTSKRGFRYSGTYILENQYYLTLTVKEKEIFDGTEWNQEYGFEGGAEVKYVIDFNKAKNELSMKDEANIFTDRDITVYVKKK